MNSHERYIKIQTLSIMVRFRNLIGKSSLGNKKAQGFLVILENLVHK